MEEEEAKIIEQYLNERIKEYKELNPNANSYEYELKLKDFFEKIKKYSKIDDSDIKELDEELKELKKKKEDLKSLKENSEMENEKKEFNEYRNVNEVDDDCTEYDDELKDIILNGDDDVDFNNDIFKTIIDNKLKEKQELEENINNISNNLKYGIIKDLETKISEKEALKEELEHDEKITKMIEELNFKENYDPNADDEEIKKKMEKEYKERKPSMFCENGFKPEFQFYLKWHEDVVNFNEFFIFLKKGADIKKFYDDCPYEITVNVEWWVHENE